MPAYYAMGYLSGGPFQHYDYRRTSACEDAERLGMSGVWQAHYQGPAPSRWPQDHQGTRGHHAAGCPLHPLVGRSAYRCGLTRAPHPCAMEVTPCGPCALRRVTGTRGPLPRPTTRLTSLLGASARCRRPASAVRGPSAGTPHPWQALPCSPTLMPHAPQPARAAEHPHAGALLCTRAAGHTPDSAPGAGPHAAHTPSATPAAGAPPPWPPRRS